MMKKFRLLLECKISVEYYNSQIMWFRNDSTFVAGGENGNVLLWKNNSLANSIQLFTGRSRRTLVMSKNDVIFAASASKEIFELNTNLETIKTHQVCSSYDGYDYYYQQPRAMDANEEYLIVGYENGDIDIKGRRDDTHGLRVSEVKFLHDSD